MEKVSFAVMKIGVVTGNSLLHGFVSLLSSHFHFVMLLLYFSLDVLKKISSCK